MNAATANRMVLVSTGAMIAFVLIERHFNPAQVDMYKRLWAVGALGVGMSLAADFVPQIAGPFALLVLVAMVARNKGQIGRVLDNMKGAPPTKTTQGKGSAAPASDGGR